MLLLLKLDPCFSSWAKTTETRHSADSMSTYAWQLIPVRISRVLLEWSMLYARNWRWSQKWLICKTLVCLPETSFSIQKTTYKFIQDTYANSQMSLYSRSHLNPIQPALFPQIAPSTLYSPALTKCVHLSVSGKWQFWRRGVMHIRSLPP